MFSATIIQVGLGVVFILMKGPLYELVFQHYIRPVGRNKLEVFHECFISNHVPYFSSYKIVQMEGEQVTNDMYIWEGKTFARKLFLNQTKDTDKVMLDWYHWASQFYDGCGYQHQRDKFSW